MTAEKTQTSEVDRNKLNALEKPKDSRLSAPRGQVPLGFDSWNAYHEWASKQVPPSGDFNYHAT